jgi:predicted RNase H-like nuclease
MTVLGIDGCPGGWLAVEYDDVVYRGAQVFDDITAIWNEYGGVETILVDSPIGLREESAAKRPCDDAARDVLGHRSSSVFPAPVRQAVYEERYEDAKAVQEAHTERSLGTQTWAISEKIRQIDELLQAHGQAARGTIREAHPELCFWALAGEQPTTYSKTGQPAAAFWERVGILEPIDEGVLDDLQDAGTHIGGQAGNDDLIDAFALAMTASALTGRCHRLPDRPAEEIEDPTGLPMEMVYAYATEET